MLWQMFLNLQQGLEQIREERRRGEAIRQELETRWAMYEAARADRQPICPDARAEADALMGRLRLG